ncbi:hypothetical protein MMC08_002429 [Hypocenomyce scalaris]|nr:hypothetical protein [Hypocenomyce scalaris]
MAVVLVPEPEPLEGAGVVVDNETGDVVMIPGAVDVVWIAEPSVTGAEAGVEKPASSEKKAVYAKGVGPQPRKTVLPSLKSLHLLPDFKIMKEERTSKLLQAQVLLSGNFRVTAVAIRQGVPMVQEMVLTFVFSASTLEQRRF